MLNLVQAFIARDRVERKHCRTIIKQFGSFLRNRIEPYCTRRNQPAKNSYMRDSGCKRHFSTDILVKSIRGHSMYVNEYFH